MAEVQVLVQVVLRYDPLSHYHWLDFGGKPDEATRAALKAAGWRFGGLRKQWYTNSVRWQVPAGIEYTDGGECQYSAERPGRLHGAALAAQDRAAQHAQVADNMADLTLWQQPTIMGKGRPKSGAALRKRLAAAITMAGQEADRAEHLAYAANSSARHQRHKVQAGTIARRIERLRAERVKVVNQLPSTIRWIVYEYKDKTDPVDLAAKAAKVAAAKADHAAILQRLDQAMQVEQQALAALGGIPFDRLGLGLGDTIKCWAGQGVIVKVNPKTVGVKVWDRVYQAERVRNIDKTEINESTIIAFADGRALPVPPAASQPHPLPAVAPDPARADRDAKLAKLQHIWEMESAVTNTKGNGYYPTPAMLAAKMVELLECLPGMRVLEPSAGKGDLIDAVLAACPGAVVECCEINHTLTEILGVKGYGVAARDFMQFDPAAPYDRIIMNPPFEDGQDMAHVQRAWGMLAPGGILVAVTGMAWQYRQGAKWEAFKGWLEAMGAEVENLPAGLFLASDRPTVVPTVLVVLERE